MADEEPDDGQRKYDRYLSERNQLIDAARESARTFDKAVLAFGSAVFGFSIAFLKDIAPTPAPETLKWLGAAWILFSLGLLAILLSFLLSHQACMFGIEDIGKALEDKDYKEARNRWSIATNWCNYLCVGFLFLGLLSWSVFAFENLSQGDTQMNKVQTPTEKLEKGYVPPPPAKGPAPQRAPAPPTAPPTTQSVPKK